MIFRPLGLFKKFLGKTDEFFLSEEFDVCKSIDDEAKERFLVQKKLLDKHYSALPEVFKKRIDRFRRNNPDFRWKYEEREMRACNRACGVANEFKCFEGIQNWQENLRVNYEQDSLRHNTDYELAFSVTLAKIYLTDPDKVITFPGLQSPLVGSREYGCAPKNFFNLPGTIMKNDIFYYIHPS